MKTINYSFSNVFLDPKYTETFIELCKKNKIIKQDILGQKAEFSNQPLTGEKRILRSLVLFDKVDFASSLYDCSELIERELVSEGSICCSNDETLITHEEEAVSIMSAYKKGIMRYLKNEYRDKLRMLQKPSTPSHEYWKTRSYDESDVNRVVITGTLSVDLDREYYSIIKNLELLYSPTTDNIAMFLNHIFFTDQISTLLGIRNNIAYALMSSEQKNSVYMSSFLDGLNNTTRSDPAENVYQFVKARLPDEVNILPNPQTIRDVWKMRQHPAMVSFRKVMNEWDYYINHNDISAAQKIKKDIIKANHNLERLEKFKKCINSPYVRTGYFLGGFVLGLSSVLNVVSFVEPFITEALLKKYSWTHINDK